MDQAEYLRLKRQQESPFAALYEAARQRDADLTAEGRRPVFGGLLSKEPVAGVGTVEYEGIKSMLLGLLSPAAKTIDAPLAAYQGNIPMEDMTAEALGTAGMAMGGGGLAARPSGSVGMGGRADDLRRQANIQRFGHDPNEVADAPALSPSGGFNDYLSAVNPDGRKIPADARPNLAMGDMYGMLPRGAREVSERDGVKFYQTDDGATYATAFNPDVGDMDVVGYSMPGGDSTELAVVSEMQGRGIGGELQYLARSQNPYAQTGGLTDAGESSLRKTYDRLRDDGIVSANAAKSGGLLGAGLSEAQRQARDTASQDIPRQLPENNVLSPVDSLTQADLDAATPFTRTSGFDAPRVGGGRAKDPALSNRYSKKKQIGVPPSDWSVSGRRLESKIDAPRLVDAEGLQESGFTDLFGFVADGTMANTVIDKINGVEFPRSVMQQGGHEFGDNKNALAFMSDGGAMSTKANIWDKLAESGGRPAVTPMTMGASGGDFSMHQTMNLVQMIQGMADNIDPNFVPLVGAAKNNNRLLPEGMGLLSPELPEYVAGLNGGQRAALVKSLDTAPALAAGVPSVGAVRWAATDPNLAGVPSLSSGYRVFEPETKEFFTLPGNHASYDTAVDRVGENMTMGNDLRPWYLQFPDEAFPKILASTPSGANMLNVDAMPKDIRGFQMNPKMSQTIDDQYVETNMKYNEIARTEGREQADLYAIDALVNRAMMSGRY
tara:strand:+ start:116 stop:2278 length:2163 start_codon:yes stop_codon:yes gene_type:complete